MGLLEVGITDKGVALLADLPHLRLLDLRGCSQISNAGLGRLRAMPNLRVLRLAGYQIDDASLAIVGDLKSLVGVTIEEAAITDAGLADLARLPLEEINLGRCYGVTDDGFQHFKHFANLRQLSIRDIPLSGSGLKYLQREGQAGPAEAQRDRHRRRGPGTPPRTEEPRPPGIATDARRRRRGGDSRPSEESAIPGHQPDGHLGSRGKTPRRAVAPLQDRPIAAALRRRRRGGHSLGVENVNIS